MSLKTIVTSIFLFIVGVSFGYSAGSNRNLNNTYEVSESSNLNKIIEEINVHQYYEWNYMNSKWYCDTYIPLSTYLYYYSRPRPTNWEDWAKMATDSYDDNYIEKLLNSFNSVAEENGYSDYEKVMLVISFVQSLPYTTDTDSGWDEHPKYPVETLFERGGDCEDSSILVAALLHDMGYDVAIILLEAENHCAIGVAGGKGIYGSYYTVDGIRYFYLETTGEGWNLGEIPTYYSDTTAKIYPLKKYG